MSGTTASPATDRKPSSQETQGVCLQSITRTGKLHTREASAVMKTLEVERLVKKERFYRDTEQWSLWRQCYHPDSLKTFINISWFSGQIDEFVQRSQRISAIGVSPIHTTDPVDIRIKKDRALAISNCTIVSRFTYEGAEFDLVARLRLVSCLSLVDSSWTMQSLEGIYLQDSIRPVAPNNDNGVTSAAIFDISEIRDLRTSYKWLIWNIERKGMKARRDLPGIDDQHSVQRVLHRAENWLENEKELPEP